ncbi:uncharacterized protein B0I36DRAFT_143001 [Microdochium trichocladiopsis]|uniref:Uncharacterized protein n=1 Tax=Microdochium trichocladiopsis TaxID=1682393 RepID=A0A9P8Y517_9PEZI|nr:uncharacterized protein B0I36DRAFT_143001 [Microdochium trichocladiopsis]KAH7027755.1 hypothetical protein B0I36DRAFT_143001 [Microdochium trichocladiopsis]
MDRSSHRLCLCLSCHCSPGARRGVREAAGWRNLCSRIHSGSRWGRRAAGAHNGLDGIIARALPKWAPPTPMWGRSPAAVPACSFLARGWPRLPSAYSLLFLHSCLIQVALFLSLCIYKSRADLFGHSPYLLSSSTQHEALLAFGGHSDVPLDRRSRSHLKIFA